MLQQLKKPELYERTAQHFWQHPYISKQLLKAHLNPDFEGQVDELALLKNRPTGLARRYRQ